VIRPAWRAHDAKAGSAALESPVASPLGEACE
jgi:hypothetical protein